MIRFSNIKMPVNYSDNDLRRKISKELRISDKDIVKLVLFKRSIDARKKSDIHFTITADVSLDIDENRVISHCKNKNVSLAKPYSYEIPNDVKLGYRPVVIGFGPAGMFAGLILAKAGAKPVIYEMGKDCDSRVADVEKFIRTGKLNTRSNIQFGEGGAGTFSDGKLTTGTKDFRARYVLSEFVAHGAPEEIMYNAMPHIGTDKLRNVVKNIRQEIIELGGEVNFESKFIKYGIKNGKIASLEIEHSGCIERVETESVIMAIGHSSRDTFEMLYNNDVFMEQKPFSVGARIEHLREDIDRAQFGDFSGNPRLGAAPYKLNVNTSNGRGVYTFCMCPGGEVVPASSEENMVCTNGMSEFSRDKENSNAALLVGVNPNDYGSSHPLAGIEYQRNIERNAFNAGGGEYAAPVQRVEDFLLNRKTKSLGAVKPSYRRGFTFCKTDDYLPEYVTEAMREAIVLMDKRLRGFASPDALLTGAEARSSSPVRITRNSETLESVSIHGLYPCGEGAGYAGGIVSAAVDGIKCAEKVLDKQKSLRSYETVKRK